MTANRTPYDHNLIASLVPEGCRVLDLGCGNGSLLQRLREDRGAFVQGVDIDPQMILECVRRGIPVCYGTIEQILPFLEDDSYDVVILSQTLQVLKRPDQVLTQMLRVGKRAIVSIPNFGYWYNRFQILFGGRMPVNRQLPYQWYDTPNIHFCTIKDLTRLIAQKGWRVERKFFLTGSRRYKGLWPNLFATEAVFLLSRCPPRGACL